MKKLFALLFLILFVFIVGCNGDSSTGTDPENGETTYSVSGKVVDASGVGITGVTVTIGNNSVTTDAQGNYSIGGLSSGNNYTLTLTKTDYTFAPQTRTIAMGAQNQSVENFVGTPTGGGGGDGSYTITGRVIDSTGTGIAGVTITASNATQTTTDAQGNYSITVLGDGAYTILPLNETYSFTPVNITVIVAGGNASAAVIVGTTGGGGGGDGFIVTGRVVDISGAGIADVTISIAGITARWEETTDASGVYTFSAIPAGSYGMVPDKNDYTFDPEFKTLMITSSNVTVGDFVGLTEGSGGDPTGEFTITGRVVDSAGNGIPDVEVEIAGPAIDTDVDTDAYGNYSFTNLANGTYSLIPDKYKYSFAPSSIEVTISGADATAGNIVGTPLGGENGFTVSGRIVDGAGAGLEGTELELWNLSNRIKIFTDAQGNYSMVDIPNGTYYVGVDKDGYEFMLSIATVVVSGADVTVDDIAGFPDGEYMVSGRVVDSTGAGIANAMVYLYFGALPVSMGFTNADGYYFLEDVQNQHYIIKPGTAGYTPAEQNITVNGADVTVDDFVKD